ncbi:antirestriction protein [Paraburkholderia youngii]|uniref:antirestriction protein n=1 Tax=Paraburkholderia youngii TaxID=2782701 RepID=UPI003D248A31
MDKETLTAVTVAENERNAFMLELFGACNLIVADRVLQGLVHRMAGDSYKGGLWLYRRTSNGALYAAPAAPESLTITVIGNYFEREMSADAAGIVLTMTAISALMESETASDDVLELLHTRYYALRDYAKTLPEREAILAAID